LDRFEPNDEVYKNGILPDEGGLRPREKARRTEYIRSANMPSSGRKRTKFYTTTQNPPHTPQKKPPKTHQPPHQNPTKQTPPPTQPTPPQQTQQTPHPKPPPPHNPTKPNHLRNNYVGRIFKPRVERALGGRTRTAQKCGGS